jgi:hypothetical protein
MGAQKKDTQTQRKQKSGFERGWCGKFEKKTTNTSLDAEFSPIVYLAFPSFHRAPYHWRGGGASGQRPTWQPPRRWSTRAARQPCDTGGWGAIRAQIKGWPRDCRFRGKEKKVMRDLSSGRGRTRLVELTADQIVAGVGRMGVV